MVGPVAEDVAERRIGGDGADAENGIAAGRSGDAVGLRRGSPVLPEAGIGIGAVGNGLPRLSPVAYVILSAKKTLLRAKNLPDSLIFQCSQYSSAKNFECKAPPGGRLPGLCRKPSAPLR